MKILNKMINLGMVLVLSIMCLGINATTVKAEVKAEDNEINEIIENERNGIATWYRSHSYTKYGSYIGYDDKYWRSDAFNAISWKGYVLNDKNGVNNYTNCSGVVFGSIQVDFNSYYQLSYGHLKNNTNYVKGIQSALKALGYDIGSTGVDGNFGPATDRAVAAFQKNNGLTADGIVGKQTYFALSKAYK